MFWPFLAVWAMKSIRGRPMATSDPDWTFERKDPLELTITPEPRLDMGFSTAPIAIIIECTSGTQETFFTRSLYQDVGISR